MAAIARSLGCSRTTVYRALSRDRDAPPDARASNGGRPRTFDDAVRSAVHKAREARPAAGPRMLHARMLRAPDRFGLAPAEVPSPAMIGRLINGWGMAPKPVGPRDQRLFPDAHPTEPGCVTVDRWGPWPIRAQRLYLATVQDRFTRLAAAVPAGAMLFDEEGFALPGLDGAVWSRALAVAQARRCDRPLESV